jgi:2-haloalkanoic acid dehalogenase type II
VREVEPDVLIRCAYGDVMLWVFDINETLLDLSPLDTVFAEEAGAVELRRAWFDLLIRTALVVTAIGGYRDFAQLGADCARATGLGDEAIARLGATMRSLPAHPDVPGALDALRESGQRLVALGNSPKQVIESQLAHAGVAGLFDGAYSAEQAGALKPAPGSLPVRARSRGRFAAAGGHGGRSRLGYRRRSRDGHGHRVRQPRRSPTTTRLARSGPDRHPPGPRCRTADLNPTTGSCSHR